jgi:hypothetical protein
VASRRSGGRRTVVVGWNCPVQDARFFVFRSAPATGRRHGRERAVADDLATRYVCIHARALPTVEPPRVVRDLEALASPRA